MKLAIVGGTFNPVHHGHLFLAENLKYVGYEKVLFIPTKKPAHKVVLGATNEQRLEMLHRALDSWTIPGLEIQIETCELYRDGVSYSIDTVNCVLEKYKIDNKPGLVMGDDLFQSFAQWKDAEALAQKVDLWIAKRLFQNPVSSNYPHSYFDNTILPLSSSDIRKRIALNKPWRSLVPPSVAQYIMEQKLYIEVDHEE